MSITPVFAAQPISNGDFETGSFAGWKTTSVNGGTATIVQKNTCFSAYDTRELNIKGNFAALLRSNNAGSTRSEAVLTSPAFNAGDGVAFSALTESADLLEKPNSVQLEVQILDASDDKVLVTQILSPQIFKLHYGCPSESRKGHFASHYFSTKAFAKAQRGIKIRFRQRTTLPGYSFFTLIDQVVKFNEGESPLFLGKPIAMAGMSYTSSGTPTLDSRGSFDPDNHIHDLGYHWVINDTDMRSLRRPCVNNLVTGEHRAVLYVNDGRNVVADPINFVVRTNYTGEAIDDTQATSNEPITALPTDTTGPVGRDPECQTEQNGVDGVGVTDPEVAVNDPDVAALNPHDLYGDVTPIGTGITTSDGETDTTNTPLTDTADTTDTEIINADGTPTNNTPPENADPSVSVTTDGNLSGTGILWKPVSEGDGNLVVLLPSSYEQSTVSVENSAGNLVETGNFIGRTNGDRPTYRFNRPGFAFSAPAILNVDGTRYTVTSPSQRTE